MFEANICFVGERSDGRSTAAADGRPSLPGADKRSDGPSDGRSNGRADGRSDAQVVGRTVGEEKK